MKAVRIRAGTVIGYEHVRLGKNNQDGCLTGSIELNGQAHFFGIVSDGCSGGNNNEVGSKLIVAYIASEMRMMLAMGARIDDIPEALFNRCIGYLRSIASLTCVGDPAQSLEFIKNHLLCTVIGFVMNNEKVVIFSAGDGVIVVNDEVIRIDQNNTPKYLAYQLVDRQFLKLHGGELPQEFTVMTFDRAALERFAICSDGMTEGAISHIWGHVHPLGVQRRLKVLVNQKNEAFADDCTVIAVELIEDQSSAAADNCELPVGQSDEIKALPTGEKR